MPRLSGEARHFDVNTLKQILSREEAANADSSDPMAFPRSSMINRLNSAPGAMMSRACRRQNSSQELVATWQERFSPPAPST